MFDATLFRRSAELARYVEHVGHQGTTANFCVAHFRVFTVLRTEYAQPLTIRTVRWIVEVAKHYLTFDPRLKN